MDFELTDEQAALREVSRGLLAETCPPPVVRSVISAQQDFPKQLWDHGAETGWTGVLVPEESGGTGLGVAELCLVAEELGRAGAPGPFIETALAAAVAGRGDEPAAPAAGLAGGQLKAAYAAGPQISVRTDGGHLVLSGRGALVQAAASADWFLVAAGGSQPRVLLVPAAGITVQRRSTLDQTRTWYDVIFDDVRVPASCLMTADEAQLRHLTDTVAVTTAADALGAGERLLEMTAAHVSVREQFGRPLGSFQVVKHKVVDMHIKLRALRAAVYYAAMSLDAGQPDAALAASAAKAYASEVAPQVAGEALQLHGGIGFTWEHDLHLFLRRAKVDALLFGDAAFHHDRVLTLLEQQPPGEAAAGAAAAWAGAEVADHG